MLKINNVEYSSVEEYIKEQVIEKKFEICAYSFENEFYGLDLLDCAKSDDIHYVKPEEMIKIASEQFEKYHRVGFEGISVDGKEIDLIIESKDVEFL